MLLVSSGSRTTKTLDINVLSVSATIPTLIVIELAALIPKSVEYCFSGYGDG